MKRKREAIEKQLMENDEEQEEQTQQDWKDLIRQSKRQRIKPCKVHLMIYRGRKKVATLNSLYLLACSIYSCRFTVF